MIDKKDIQTPIYHIRVFISSPNDVAEERAIAVRVIENLAYDPLLRGQVTFESVAWDRPATHTPMLATMSPQEAIDSGLPKPSECDIVVTILWSRMGTVLSKEFVKPKAYRFPTVTEWEDWRYLSGTEWEYIDAMEASRETGKPYVLVYRCTKRCTVDVKDPDLEIKGRQSRLVDSFFATFLNTDSSVKKGYNTYESPSDFKEQLEFHLRDITKKLLDDERRKHGLDIAFSPNKHAELWTGSPFPGLRSFGPDEAPIFFGRGHETDEVIDLLRQLSLVTVVGASGSGKSSLVGAGVIPRLKDNAIEGSKDWVIVRFTPDELGSGNPFVSLAAALRNDPLNIRERGLVNLLSQEPTALELLCTTALPQDKRWSKVVIFIDQFEELFTGIRPSERIAFIAMLHHWALSERLRLLLTLRADFYSRCLEYPNLAELLKPSTYPLAIPKRDALREIVEYPARRAGLTFESGLVNRILDDAGDDPGAMALTAFALQQLYTARQDEYLTHEAYDAFGGVQGAIGQQAQDAFDSLDEEAQSALPLVFRELVAVNEEGVPTRKRAEAAQIEREEAAHRLVAELTEKRLLVRSRGDENIPVIEVAHEALFNQWPQLHQWLQDTREDIWFHQMIREDVREWLRHGRRSAELYRDARLQEALDWAKRYAPDRDIQAFLDASSELVRHLSETMFLQEVSQGVASVLDLQEIFERVSKIAIAFKYPLLGLYTLEGRELVLQAHHGYDEEVVERLRRVKVDEGILGRSIIQKEPIFVENVREDPDYEPVLGWVTSMVIVPVLSDEFILGVLVVQSGADKPLTENDLQLLRTFAGQVSTAMMNASLYAEVVKLSEELERRVEERTRELREERDRIDTLFRITVELTASLDLDRVLNRALELGADAVDAEHGLLYLVDPQSEMLILKAIVSSQQLFPLVVFNRHEGMAGWVMDNRESIVVDNVQADPRWVNVPGTEHTHSLLGAPLIANEEVLGCIFFTSDLPNAFHEGHRRLAEAVANQVATSINNAELYRLIRDQAERLGTMLRSQQTESARSQAILESIADGVMVSDQAGEVILFNAASERILGLHRNTALGKQATKMIGVYGVKVERWTQLLDEWSKDPSAHQDTFLSEQIEVGEQIVSVHISPVAHGDELLGFVWILHETPTVQDA